MKHPDYISTKEFAAALHVHPETIRRWRRMGKLEPALVTPGGQAMYSRQQIDLFYHKTNPVQGSDMPACGQNQTRG